MGGGYQCLSKGAYKSWEAGYTQKSSRVSNYGEEKNDLDDLKLLINVTK